LSIGKVLWVNSVSPPVKPEKNEVAGARRQLAHRLGDLFDIALADRLERVADAVQRNRGRARGNTGRSQSPRHGHQQAECRGDDRGQVRQRRSKRGNPQPGIPVGGADPLVRRDSLLLAALGGLADLLDSLGQRLVAGLQFLDVRARTIGELLRRLARYAQIRQILGDIQL
jgi:hypothetical protein